MPLPPTRVLRLERRNFYLRVRIDDPATRNAMTDALVGDLEAVLEATADDRALRALVIEGTEGAFCAGADLKAVGAAAGDDLQGRSPAWLANRRGGRLYQRLNAHPMAVIALVDGPAMGGGMGLVCCADLIICTRRARFALSETSLGLVPAQIAPYVVGRLGLATARRLALSGARLDGEGALGIGLADQLAESAEDMEARLVTALNDIGRCARDANALTKRLLLSCADGVDESYPDQAADAFARCAGGQEGQEGMAAFAGKRRPAWVEAV